MKKNIKMIFTLLLTSLILVGCGTKGETGPQGPKGDQGETGPQGPQGESGKDGLDGKTAYELYCEAHKDYKGTLEEWLDEFFTKDETDYSKYDDFLFYDVTYGGVVGYGANYIGTKSIISFPSTFKNKPVLFATVADSEFTPHYEEDKALPVLEEIHYPSTVKSINITKNIEERYDTSNVKSYFEAGIDSYNATYLSLEVYFDSNLKSDYFATNLPEHFPFSNVYLNNENQIVSRSDNIKYFTDNYYNIKGGIKDQILAVMGGTNDFYKFGDFELVFPKKFDVEIDGYDISLPLNFNNIECIDSYPGIAFDKNILKGNVDKYGFNSGYEFSICVDLGLGGDVLLTDLSFHAFKDATKIIVGNNDPIYFEQGTTIASNEIKLVTGENIISIYHNDELLTNKAPFILSSEMSTNVELNNSGNVSKFIVNNDITYSVRFDIDTFEVLLASNELAENASSLLKVAFKEDANYIGSIGIVIDEKEMYCPKERKIKVGDDEYNFKLSYEYGISELVENIDTEHPKIRYVAEYDDDENGSISTTIKVTYSFANGFLRGYFTYPVEIYKYSPSLDVSINTRISGTKSMIYDESSNGIWRLNDIVIEDVPDVNFGINSLMAGFKFKDGSLGTMQNGHYFLDPGLYNITIDLLNETVDFQNSSGEYTESVRREFYKLLKDCGYNIYIDENKGDIVTFENTTGTETKFGTSFVFEDNNSQQITVNFELHDSYSYTILGNEEDGFGLFFYFDFDDTLSAERGINMSLRVDSYFLDFSEICLKSTFRYLPNLRLGMESPTKVENNIFTFDIFLDEPYYQIHLVPHGERDTFQFESGEGAPFYIDSDLILHAPLESQNNTYRFIFNLNTMKVSCYKINI